MNRYIFFTLLLLSVILFFSCKKEKDNDVNTAKPVVFSAAGAIQNKVDEFRSVLGTLNTAPGATNGRREINWEGVPDSLLNKKLPSDFFNPVGQNAPAARQRGLVYDAAGNFQVSSSRFSHVNAVAASEFTAFSGTKTFANVSSAQWEVKFQQPGSSTTGFVRGFGAVFSDVDADQTTSLEFFEGEQSLGKFFVPKKTAESNFSFLGIYFPDRKITAVKITHQGILSEGKADLSNGGTDDLVVLDDFIYSEPLKNQ